MELDTHAFIDEHDILFGNSWEDKSLMAQPEEAFIFDEINSFVEQPEQNYYMPEPQVQPTANNVLFCNDMSQLHAIQNTFSMNAVPFIIVNVADQQQQYQQQQIMPSPVMLQGYTFGSPCPSPYAQSPSPYTPIDEFSGMSLSAMSPGYPTSPQQPQYRYNGKRRESFNDAEDLVKRMKLDQQFGTRFKGTSAESTPTIKEEDIELNEAELSSPGIAADNEVMFVGEVKNRMRRSRTISGISGKTSENNLKRQRVQKMKRSQTLNSINNEVPSPSPLLSPAPSPATPMTPSGEDWAGTRTEFRYLVSMGHKRRKNKKAAPEDAFMSRFSLKY